MAKKTYTTTTVLKESSQWKVSQSNSEYETYYYDFDVTSVLNNPKYPNAELVDVKYTLSLDHGALRYSLETEYAREGTEPTTVEMIDGYSDQLVSLKNEVISALQGNSTMQAMMAWMLRKGSGRGRFRAHILNPGQYAIGPVTVTFVYEYGTTYTPTTFTVSSSNIGTASTLVLSNSTLSDASSIVHSATWTFGSHRHTVTNRSVSNISYAIPASWASTLGSNATSGTCSVTLTTTADGATIGTDTHTFTLRLPSQIGRPTANTPTIERLPDEQTFSGMTLQGVDKIRIECTGSAKYGASITRWTVSGGTSATKSGTSLQLDVVPTSAGSVSYSVVCRDSREFTSAAKTASITVTPYTAPVFSSLTVRRVNALGQEDDEGTTCLVSAKGTYSVAEGNNSISTARLDYKEATATNYTAGPRLTDSAYSSYVSIADGVIRVTNLPMPITFVAATKYNIRILVKDAVGKTSTRATTLNPTSYTIHLKNGGDGVAFGKIAEHTKTVEVNNTWTLRTSLIDMPDSGAYPLTIGMTTNASAAQSRNIRFMYPGSTSNIKGVFRLNYASNRFQFLQRKNDSANADTFSFPSSSETDATDNDYTILTTKSPVSIAQGGTGGTSQTTALRSLGLAYSPGTYSISNLGVSGYITGSAKSLYLYFNLPQWLLGFGSSNITIGDLTGVIRTSDGGYLNSESSAIDWASLSGVSVSVLKVTQTQIRIFLQNSGTFANVTNNTPLFYTGSLTFTITE